MKIMRSKAAPLQPSMLRLATEGEAGAGAGAEEALLAAAGGSGVDGEAGRQAQLEAAVGQLNAIKERCLDRDAAQRPTVEQLLHDYAFLQVRPSPHHALAVQRNKV